MLINLADNKIRGVGKASFKERAREIRRMDGWLAFPGARTVRLQQPAQTQAGGGSDSSVPLITSIFLGQ